MVEEILPSSILPQRNKLPVPDENQFKQPIELQIFNTC
jgi:hypothetical protein